MKRVAIIGIGLMGGSIGLALRRHGFPGIVSGYARRAEVRALALREGLVQEATDDPALAVEGADLTVLCLPILANAEVLGRCAHALKPGSLVTDVGSTKLTLMEQAAPLAKRAGARFVGSHPIAGSEQQGAEAARADLYENALVVVAPDEGDDAEATEAVCSFWRLLGARVRVLNAAAHDAVLARTSHLPHLAASALALAVGREGGAEDLGTFCGPGFVDSTRVAEGSPDVWLDILRTNRHNVAAELDAFAERLHAFRRALAAADDPALLRLLEQGRHARRAMMQGKIGATG